MLLRPNYERRERDKIDERRPILPKADPKERRTTAANDERTGLPKTLIRKNRERLQRTMNEQEDPYAYPKDRLRRTMNEAKEEPRFIFSVPFAVQSFQRPVRKDPFVRERPTSIFNRAEYNRMRSFYY
jgi:hypothetical protein